MRVLNTGCVSSFLVSMTPIIHTKKPLSTKKIDYNEINIYIGLYQENFRFILGRAGERRQASPALGGRERTVCACPAGLGICAMAERCHGQNYLKSFASMPSSLHFFDRWLRLTPMIRPAADMFPFDMVNASSTKSLSHQTSQSLKVGISSFGIISACIDNHRRTASLCHVQDSLWLARSKSSGLISA